MSFGWTSPSSLFTPNYFLKKKEEDRCPSVAFCGAKSEGGKAYPEVTPSFFAEFLNEDSPVPLGLLALSTGGGLRYGATHMHLRGISRKALHMNR